MPEVTISINGNEYQAESGATILAAAAANGVHIPTLCHFEGLPGRANCRMCIVEVEKMRGFQPACVTKIRDGMVIRTETEEIRNARKTTLELIMSDHAVDCHHCLRIGSTDEQNLDPKFCECCFWCDCVRDGFCELQTLCREYHVDVLPYVQHEHDYEEDVSLGSVARNPNKCVKCRRCVDVCNDVQTVHNLSMAKRGREIEVVPELGHDMAHSACVRCGRCVDVCPCGAVYLQEHKDDVLYWAHSYEYRTAACVGADVLPELERLYRLQPGSITLQQLSAALRKLGFDEVYDTDEFINQAALRLENSVAKKSGTAPVYVTTSFAVRNFVEKQLPGSAASVVFGESPLSLFGQAMRAKASADGRRLKTVFISAHGENAAEAAETGAVDYAVSARELYRIFLRSGGAPARRRPAPLDTLGIAECSPLTALLRPRDFSLSAEAEMAELTLGGKKLSAAVTRNLGQTRAALADAGGCGLTVLNS